MVLLLSVALVTFIAYDTLNAIPFAENSSYMTFQLWVCIVFMLDFVIGLVFARRKWRYVARRWLFLLISIPFLNIIDAINLDIPNQWLYLIRFIPLIRGALALSIAISYITANRITGLFYSYLIILVAIIFFASLIMLQYEQPVNPQIPDYQTALWWACMDATTIGSDINPVTGIGKILAILLAAMGMILFPLFTVYFTDLVNKSKSPD